MPVMAPGRGDVIVAGAVVLVDHDASVRLRPCPGERDRHPGRARLRDARHPVTSSAVCRSDPGTSNSRNSRAPPGRAARRQAPPRPHDRAGRRRHRRLVLVVVGASDPARRRRRTSSRRPASRSGVGRARHPDGHGHAAGRVAPATVACGGEAPPKRRQAQAPVRGAAADDDRSRRDLHGHDRDLVRHDSRSSCCPEIAPEAVNSFVFLAEQGFYDGLTFHRIVEGFVIQGGDPSGTGTGGPGLRVPRHRDLAGVRRSTPRAARLRERRPGANGSQFFITLAPAPQPRSGPNGRVHDLRKRHEGHGRGRAIGPCPR